MELIPNKAYHITVAGKIEEIRPANGEDFESKRFRAE